MEIDGTAAIGAAAGMGAAVLTAVVALFKNIVSRIARVDVKVDSLSESKADKERVEGIADNLGEAFKEAREDKTAVLEALAAMTGAFHKHELAYTNAVGETKMQLARIASDMESEKRTRASSNSRIDDRFVEIERAIDRNGRH